MVSLRNGTHGSRSCQTRTCSHQLVVITGIYGDHFDGPFVAAELDVAVDVANGLVDVVADLRRRVGVVDDGYGQAGRDAGRRSVRLGRIVVLLRLLFLGARGRRGDQQQQQTGNSHMHVYRRVMSRRDLKLDSLDLDMKAQVSVAVEQVWSHLLRRETK